tara:strand:+ start:1290 stop:1556 length:267 start_codon:yes stop_codon:yes gene_type:complete
MSSKYYVYVIKLDEKVSNFKKFRSKNPLYLKGSGCVYIGQSIRTPSLRFEQHKEGYKSNSYAREYGIKLFLSFMINTIEFLQEEMQKT